MCAYAILASKKYFFYNNPSIIILLHNKYMSSNRFKRDYENFNIKIGLKLGDQTNISS